MSKPDLLPLLSRVADALERLAPPAPPKAELATPPGPIARTDAPVTPKPDSGTSS